MEQQESNIITLDDVSKFLRENPPKAKLSRREIDEILLNNTEILLNFQKDYKAKKNKNFLNSSNMSDSK